MSPARLDPRDHELCPSFTSSLNSAVHAEAVCEKLCLSGWRSVLLCLAPGCIPSKVCNCLANDYLHAHNLVAYLEPLHSLGTKLVAVYSRSRRSAADTAEEAKNLSDFILPNLEIYHDEGSAPGLDDLLQREDLHAVVISLPTLVQPAVALKALAAGKHVVSRFGRNAVSKCDEQGF